MSEHDETPTHGEHAATPDAASPTDHDSSPSASSPDRQVDGLPRDDVAWWSQPGQSPLLDQTAVLDPDLHATASHPLGAAAPLGPPVPVAAAPERERRRRGGLVALGLALALLAGGGAGGLVAHQLDGTDSSTTTLTSASGGVQQTAATAAGTGTTGGTTGTAQSAAATIAPSVVTIEVSGTTSSSSGDGFGGFGGSGGSTQTADTGSGIVIRSDGYVLTNNHVVAAAENGAGTVHVTLSGGNTVSASIVGFDATSDLAVIKLADTSGLTAATFANSDDLAVGQSVIAVGAPLGLSNTVTEGIVSTLHRPVATGETGASAQSVLDAIQTDAAINPGNSGGALVDLAGHVVGVNSAIATTGTSSDTTTQSGNIGVGFAIPANDAAKVADQLIKTGKAVHAQIGISAADAASSTTGAPGLGATVRSVTAGSPASSAGLQQGDVITKVDDRLVTDANSLIVAIRAHDPGSKVTVTYTRGGSTKTAQVTLGSSS